MSGTSCGSTVSLRRLAAYSRRPSRLSRSSSSTSSWPFCTASQTRDVSTSLSAQVADEYLEDRAFQELAPGTQKKYREALNRRVLPHFGERPISEITTDEIAAWLDALRSAPRARMLDGRAHGLSESTLNGALSPLRCVFKFAAARSRQYISDNPIDALEAGERPNSQMNAMPVQVLDPSDLARLLDAAPEGFRFMLEVKAGTGLRSSELRGLIWGDIELDRKRIKVSRQIDTDDRGHRVAIKDRGLSDHRYVPLTDALTEKLRDHRARMAEYTLSEPGAFVFGGDRHVKHDKLDRAFKTAIAGAKIERDPDKRLSPHSLRHGYGSMLLASGEQLVNVSRWLGHRKLSTTERVYVHQIESLDDIAAERMRERERLASSVASTA